MEADLKGVGALFVRRPVLAVVLSLLIVLSGLAALLGVEVRELPNVDRPVVTVTTYYTGATPEVIDTEVTSILEKAVGRSPGIVSVSSQSRFGRSRITAEFSDATDVETAANDVRDAVSRVTRQLPDDADDPSIVKADADADAVMRLAVRAPGMSVEEVTQLVNDRIVDRIAAVAGVADVTVYGDRDPVFTIAVDPLAVASRGLAPDDMKEVVADLAANVSAGSVKTDKQELVVRADNNIKTVQDIARLKIDENTRISDVAHVSYGPERRTTIFSANGESGVGMGIVRQAKSNTIDVSNGVRAAVAKLNESLPHGVTVQVMSDDADFISGAISEVVLSLFLATGIVILIIFIFLGSVSATLIPAVTVPIALCGTIAAIWFAGFSVNVLTLLALVLATGMVVDDAIVVLENIMRRISKGDGPRAAAVIGAREVFFAVITTTATLAAVFIPISFLPGSVGRLFSEFGFVLAISVMLSSFVALTLAPMMASRLLKAKKSEAEQKSPSFLRRGVSALGLRFQRIYGWGLEFSLKAPSVVIAGSLMFCVFGVVQYESLPKELTPREDRGLVFLSVRTPQGASVEYTRNKIRQIETIIQKTIDAGEGESFLSIAGTGGTSNGGFIFLKLLPWDERERNQALIAAEINRQVSRLTGVKVYVRQPNTLGVRGAGSGLRFALSGGDYDVLDAAAQNLTQKMQDELGEKIGRVSIDYDTTQPQLLVHVNREVAKELGVSVQNIAQLLRLLLDGDTAAEVFIGDDSIPVNIEAGGAPLRTTRDLENLFVRTKDGTMVPLSSVVSIEETAVAPQLNREAQLRAIPVSIGLADGYDLATAVEDMRAIADEVLPPGVTTTLLSEAALLEQTSSNVFITFGFAIVVIFLVLAAQFESFISAMIILLTVPFGLAAAIVAITLTGGSINVYSQIGIIMLVGLMAKNGILIVEFANQLREEGQDVESAIRDACLLRLRPVMMTMISTVLGGLPLVFAFGAGAEAREALGWIVVGGLGFATLSTLLVTPAAYRLLAPFSKSRNASELRLAEEMKAAR